MERKKIYCSLDIETSGFDPVKDEILEIGFVFFTVNEKGVKLGEEYSRIFKPEKEVSETILALTGITKKELESAENFDKYREEIQSKLKGACLVGHNIAFDIKFLQGLGLEFSGQSVDTLDLAQFILPTHLSYNLENLMHFFGVPHIDAHRALADAKAALKVLEGLLKTFAGFSIKLKQEIADILKPSQAAFKDFFVFDFKGITVKPRAEKNKFPPPEYSIELKDKIFYNFPLGADIPALAAKNLTASKSKNLLVAPGIKTVLDLSKAGICVPVFSSDQLFNRASFEAFKKKAALSLDELKFVLKILVWQSTNWQTENISDLNLSFFGGQFRYIISGGLNKERAREKFLACDIKAFFEFKQKGWYKNRKVVFLSLVDLEKALEGNIGEKLSWGHITYLLKSVYNPDFGGGEEKYKKIVEAGLLACDLFFGLTSALLQTDPPGFAQKKLEDIEENIIIKIRAAAENFQAKLEGINQQIQSLGISEFSQKLNKFFTLEVNNIKWVELSPKSCVFNSSPINIQDLFKEALTFNRETVFCDCLPPEQVWEYFQQRLGLKEFNMQFVEVKRKKQKDLFSFLGANGESFKPEAKAENLSDEEILKFCEKSFLPAAVLLGSGLQIKNFYHQHHETLQKTAFVLAQSGGTGNSRILRNFTIHKESLLLASDKFILKSLVGKGAGVALGNLPVKTLVLGRLPFEQFTHPYLEAVSKQFVKPFEEFSLPRALINLHTIIKFFYTPSLKQFNIYDSKLNKPYARVFTDYLNQIVDKPL